MQWYKSRAKKCKKMILKNNFSGYWITQFLRKLCRMWENRNIKVKTPEAIRNYLVPDFVLL